MSTRSIGAIHADIIANNNALEETTRTLAARVGDARRLSDEMQRAIEASVASLTNINPTPTMARVRPVSDGARELATQLAAGGHQRSVDV